MKSNAKIKRTILTCAENVSLSTGIFFISFYKAIDVFWQKMIILTKTSLAQSTKLSTGCP